MLKRGHKLQVGQAGIVGYVTGTGAPRIALDVGEDKVYFQNPDLPQTRSEMALPLAVSGNVIGALDVQSTEEAAFGEEDLMTLRVLADQISIAIDNARLFSESQSAVESVRLAYGEIRSTAWQNIFVEKQKPFGYSSLSNGKIIPVAEESSPESLKAIQTGIPTLSKDKSTLHVPVKVLGSSIGVIILKQRGGARWTAQDIEVVNTLSDQLGTALESARLYEQIRERARTESLITDITSKIGSSIELDTIMETTVEEIGRIFGGSEILLQFKREK
jgi:GAF domain-containing protein